MTFEPALKTPLLTRLKWHDEFDGDLSKWYQDDFTVDGWNRTGSKYLRADGSIDMNRPWTEIPARAAAFYDKHREKCQFIRDGNLVMKGYAVNEPNLYRDNYTDNQGVVHPYGEWLLYDPWLSTFGRKKVGKKWVADPSKTTMTCGPGTVIEVRVNAEAQCMGGHRWNFWFMPVTGKAYDEDVSDVEIDCPEIENPSRAKDSSFGGHALLKVVGGDAGDTPNDNVDLLLFGVDLRVGWHTFTTVWQHDGSLLFYVDGILCNQDPRKVTMLGYLIMAREMNSGVKEPHCHEWENPTTGPKMPVDSGLTAESVITYLDLIEVDEILVSHVRVWDILTDDTVPDPKIDHDDCIDEISLLTERCKKTDLLNFEQAEKISELSDTLEKARDAVSHLLEM